jgi:cytochrome c oxidase subunit 1/cytochrome c oxidase subunit I+III
LWEGRLNETRSDTYVEAGLVLDKGRENVGTTPLDAQPDAILKMPGDSLAPFILSLCLTAIFVGLLLNLWVLVGLALVASAAAVLGWLWPESKLGETRAGVHV